MIYRGITGLSSQILEDSTAPVKFYDFKAACYFVAQCHNLQIKNITQPNVTPNFYRAYFVSRDIKIWTLCNISFPIIAFAKSLDNYFQEGF